MAIIGTIRERFGVLISILIGGALLVFLIMAALNSESSVFRNQKTKIAEINGTSIEFNEFASIENSNTEQYEMFNANGKAIDEQTRQSIREQSWNELVQKTIYQHKYDQLGIMVSNEELQSQLAGNNPHQVIRQQFGDPKTGQFSPSNVTRFLNSEDFKSNKENVQKRWFFIKEYVSKDRYSNKFNKLLTKGFYVPKFMVDMDAKEKTDKANFQYAFVPYTTIADDKVKPTDDEIKEYAENHKKLYAKEEEERKIDFVSFDLVPSAEDITAANHSLAILVDSFHRAKDDSLMVAANSETDVDGKYYTKATLPSSIKDTFFSKAVKAVVGPYTEGGFIKISKIVNRKPMPDSVKASHILLAAQGGDTSVVNRRADSILAAIKKGANFAELAKKYSADPGSKDKGGDLGYFPSGRMVPEFDAACFNGKKGDIKKVLTQFGIHLIAVVDQKGINNSVQVFTIAKSLLPSRATEQSVTAKANEFASKNNTGAAFDAAAKTMGVQNRGLKQNDATIMGINGSARELIKNFVFGEDTKVGNVSNVVTIDNKLVIAKLSAIAEKGKVDIETNKGAIENEIRKQKKIDMIAKDMATKLAGKSSIAEAASAIGDSVHTAVGVSFSQPSLSTGYEPAVVGAAFGLKQGAISKPIGGNGGVFVITVNGIEAGQPNPMMNNRANLESQYSGGIEYRLLGELKKHTDITDKRISFF
jgi:peptidyl-prolyl cis-trans isomerase D